MRSLKPTDRQMLVGLCGLVGTFEVAIKIIPDLLTIIGTSTEASWSLEDLRLLTERKWQKPEDVGHGINVQAVLFPIHASIQAGLSQHRTAQMQRLHERLVASQSQGSKS